MAPNLVRLVQIRDHLGKIVRGSVEGEEGPRRPVAPRKLDEPDALLNAEADHLVGAGRYECTEVRRDIRAGSYERKLQTGVGEVRLRVPKLRHHTLETAIIERSRRDGA